MINEGVEDRLGHWGCAGGVEVNMISWETGAEEGKLGGSEEGEGEGEGFRSHHEEARWTSSRGEQLLRGRRKPDARVLRAQLVS